METKYIYMDHAATTKTKKEVVEAMLPYLTEYYGNASSIYTFAGQSRKILDESRQILADAIGANKDEIIFTASGTEADNHAIKGVMARARRISKGKKNKLITSKIEHHAVLHACEYLEKDGYDVVYLDVDKDGLVDLEQLEASIDDKTVMVSIMYANNEVGTIEPIEEIGKIAKKHGIYFHTDAVQAMGQIEIDVDKQGIDLLSMSAHKFYGPKGVGALYIRKGTKIDVFMHGGAQEKRKRAGTENLASIAGMAKALSLAVENREKETKRLTELRDYTIAKIEKSIPYVKLNGHRNRRLANNVNFSFEFIEGEALLLMLDYYNICASSGSACTSGSLDPSHVLLSMGLKHEIAHGSLRLTFGEETTKEQIDFMIDKLKGIVNKLRMMSPLYEES